MIEAAALSIYTIGHSTHPIERFIDLLAGAGGALQQLRGVLSASMVSLDFPHRHDSTALLLRC